MDEHMKMAIEVREKIAKAVFEDKVSSRDIDEVEYKIIEDALRTTASKSEKDGWNKAVEECFNIVMGHECGEDCYYGQECLEPVSKAIRRLIREEK